MADRFVQQGEIIATAPGNRLKVIGPSMGQRYFMIVVGGFTVLDAALSNESAPALPYRLFFKMAEEIKPMKGNLSYFHVPSLLEYFQVAKTTLYSAHHTLIKVGLIRKVRKGHYLLNPHIIWSGSTFERIVAVKEWDAVKGMRVEDTRFTPLTDNEPLKPIGPFMHGVDIIESDEG